MKVAIYSRFSTDTQDVTSIDGQITNCKILAERDKLEIVATYQDEGISGNDDNRPDYQRMLKDLEAGKFDGIICDETSRITRNHSELLRLVDELRYRDQVLITFDGVDTRSESAQILLGVKGAMDQMEARKIGLRVYRSHKERHVAGHSAGGKIYGYSSKQDGDYRKRVIDDEQAPVVLEIFERYANGESAKTIVRDFNERGVRTPGSYWKNVKRRSIGWSHTTLLGCHTKASGILRNPIYKGADTWNKRVSKKRPGTGRRTQKARPESEWIAFQDESLRIVSDELFDAVKGRLRSARERTSPENKVGRPTRYLLTGLLKCSSCGSNYIVRNGKDYGCSSQGNGRDALCDQRIMIKRADAERKLLGGIKEQFLDPKFIKEITKEIRRKARRPKTRPSVAKKQIAELELQIQNVVDGIVAAGQSDALTARLRELERRKADLEAISCTTPCANIVTGAESKWREIVGNLENLRHYATPDEISTAREVIREIVGEISVVERGTHVFAKTMLNENMGLNSGAEKRT